MTTASSIKPEIPALLPDAVILTSVEFDHAISTRSRRGGNAFKRLINLIRAGKSHAFDTGESIDRCLERALCPVRTLWFLIAPPGVSLI